MAPNYVMIQGDYHQALEAAMLEQHRPLSDWYVGITSSPDRSTEDHRATKTIVINALTEERAREIKQYFHDRCFTSPEGQGGGNEASTFVFAIALSDETRPTRLEAQYEKVNRGLAPHAQASGYRK